MADLSSMKIAGTDLTLLDYVNERARGYEFHDRECPLCGDPAISSPDGEKYFFTDEEWEAASRFRCIECGTLFSAHRVGDVVVRKVIDEPSGDDGAADGKVIDIEP
jgi:hypothetical protein